MDPVVNLALDMHLQLVGDVDRTSEGMAKNQYYHVWSHCMHAPKVQRKTSSLLSDGLPVCLTYLKGFD